MRKRAAMRLRIGHERVATVEGRVEPLVTVAGPRVRQLHAPQQMPILRACCRPQTEGAIDVHPGAMLARNRNELGKGIEGADVEVAGLQQDDRGSRQFAFEGLRQGRRLELASCVAWQGRDGTLAESEDANGALDRAVALAARDDADVGRARKAQLLDIPSRSLEEPVAGRGETR